MSYGLPKSVEINGKEFAIRYDYRVILDIFEAMNDPDSSEETALLTCSRSSTSTLTN
mgnify:CR=1 FL=1